MENPEADIMNSNYTTEKMEVTLVHFLTSISLIDVSKEAMLHIPAYEIAEFLKDWSLEFAPEYSYIFDDMDLLVKILDLGRDEKKPRKDLVYARQIMEFISYFYDQSLKSLMKSLPKLKQIR